MLCILKVIVATVILMLVGTNLIGFVVRGIVWAPPSTDGPTDRVRELLRHESRRVSVANRAMTCFAVLLAVAYLFALFYFWNIWLALAGSLIMVARIPDLLWEIRTGKKATRKNLPKSSVHIVAQAFFWGSIPLIWYSLCVWTS